MNTLQRRLAEKRANEEAGFTLIELLVVIVILGILAAVVVFSVRGITDRGNKSACEATRTAILTAAEASFAQDGAYGATLKELSDDGYLTAGGVTIVGSDLIFRGKNFDVTYTPGSTTAGPTAIGSAKAVAATSTSVCPA